METWQPRSAPSAAVMLVWFVMFISGCRHITVEACLLALGTARGAAQCTGYLDALKPPHHPPRT